MKIVFMGTSRFAVPALKALISSKHEISAVYTKQPKPAGRGKAHIPSPVYKVAESNGLEIYTPKSLKDVQEVKHLKQLEPDIIVVAAYGLILTEEVLSIPKHYCVNIHPSSLPRWRGATPIQRTIMANDKHTSICIMRVEKGLDTGDIIKQIPVEIADDMTAKELHDFCAEKGAELLLQVLTEIESGTATLISQSETGITYASKLTSEEERINWEQRADLVHAQIRALSPKPGAYFTFREEKVKIITAEIVSEGEVRGNPGEVLDDKCTVACRSGALRPTLMQRTGRKMIYTDAFLRGFPINKGEIL